MRNTRRLETPHQAFAPMERELFDAATGKSGPTLQRFLFGAAAGAAVALLFAPQAGSESRSWVKDRSRRLRGDASDGLGRVKDALNEGADMVRQSVAAGRDAYRTAREESRLASTYEA